MLDKKTIDELKAKHGVIYGKKVDGDVFVFREANREDMRRFINMRKDDAFKANEVLCLDCVVLPENDDLLVAFDKRSGLIGELAGEIAENSGLVQGDPPTLIEHPEHGEVWKKTIESTTYLFTTPRRTEMHRVSKKQAEGDLFKAFELACSAGAVEPKGDDLTALLEKRPGHVCSLAAAIFSKTAVDEGDEAKKL